MLSGKNCFSFDCDIPYGPFLLKLEIMLFFFRSLLHEVQVVWL